MTEPKRRPPAEAGLTLVEILVATTLLGLLSGGMVLGLQIAGQSWGSARERLTLDRRVASSNLLLHAQFAGVTPVVSLPGPGTAAPRGPFFQGEPSEMRFVSSYSMKEGVRGGLQIVELNVAEGAEGLRLLLTQSPYRGPLSIGRFILGAEPTAAGRVRLLFHPIRTRPDTLIVADRLKNCRFSYLRGGRRYEPAVWLDVWDDPQRLPSAVRVLLQPAGDEPRLQPVSITAELRAQYVPLDTRGRAPDLSQAEIIQTPRGPVLRRKPGLP